MASRAARRLSEGHTEVVTKLIAANADVNQADNDGTTPLYIACQEGPHRGRREAARRERRRWTRPTTWRHADGHRLPVRPPRLRPAPLLLRRQPHLPFDAPHDTAEHFATHDRGHHDILAWLVRSRLWSTTLHHLEFLTPERALALLRAGADLHAAAEPGGPTPLSLAQALAAAGGAAEGTAAFLVLEAAKPWSRKTHKYFPEPARARAVELLRVGQWFKRLPSDFPIPFEVFEVFVMPHLVTRDYQPPATD